MTSTAKIVFISDTHGQHRRIQMPYGDILIHAGDLCSFGTLEEVRDFSNWIKSLKFKECVIVPGNHDHAFVQSRAQCQELLQPAHVLTEGQVTLKCGLTISGHSYMPQFGQWDFMLPRGGLELQKKVEAIKECDILVSHGPAFGVLDQTVDGTSAGCEHLLKRVTELQPKYLLVGHIHEAAGITTLSSTTVINGAQLNEKYKLTNKPWVFTVEVKDQ